MTSSSYAAKDKEFGYADDLNLVFNIEQDIKVMYLTELVEKSTLLRYSLSLAL